MQDKVLEEITADLNSQIALPGDLTIAFSECGVVNAFYNPETHAIHMCYELIVRFVELFQPYAKSEEELEKAVDDATTFVFYHELGHALADILDLPITGKEEDAVDQLSTFILAEGDDKEENAAFNGATWFILEAQQRGSKVDPLAFADEHSLNEQRFYNILCWLYGQDQQRYAFIVSDGILPETRAQRCPNEYAKLAKSWGALLTPHMKR
jgi:hypothetical protein